VVFEFGPEDSDESGETGRSARWIPTGWIDVGEPSCRKRTAVVPETF
jgi:hypothetical protein